MFFNYDSFEIVAIAFVVSGVLTYFFYNSSASINNESLINTTKTTTLDQTFLGETNISNSTLQTTAPATHSPTLDSISNLPLVNIDHLDVGVQVHLDADVQATSTYVNTGMQTSARMWLESVKSWITEILSSPTQAGKYVDVGVQTNDTSIWNTVKQWLFDILSVRDSELSSIGINKVTKWRNKLDSIQSVDLHDSNSSLTNLKFGTDSELQKLVTPDESASQISEVISKSNLQNVETVNRVYDITDQAVLTNLMDDPTVYSYFDITEQIHYVISDVILTVDPSLFIGFI